MTGIARRTRSIGGVAAANPAAARRGFSAVETMAALALLAVVSTMPLFVRHGRLLADSRQERIAIEELANQAARLVALPADDRDAALAALAPSAVAARRLPGARLTATRGPSPLGDRVVLQLAWDATGRREHPLSLAVWLPAAPGGAR
jgi:prepilin-type N-terminal cleavage/methylation domain-containing protein